MWWQLLYLFTYKLSDILQRGDNIVFLYREKQSQKEFYFYDEW